MGYNQYNGLPGVEGIVNITDYPNEYYIAAYSPDAGNQGSLIVSIMSFASKDLTDMLLKSLKITKA